MRLTLKGFAIALAVMVVAGGGVATAKSLITGKNVKNNSLTGKDIKNRSIKQKDISRGSISRNRLTKGVRKLLDAGGPQGPKGNTGPKGGTGPGGGSGGSAGAQSFGDTHWGIIYRNTIKGPGITLGAGPFVGDGTAAGNTPPFGDGSLSFLVGDGTEKAAFGNEVDFQGNNLSDLDQAGFRVFKTGEDGANNMPSIAIEIDPDGSGPGIDNEGTGADPAPANFSTLVFTPSDSTANQWSGYIDGNDPAAKWGLTGAQFNGFPNADAHCGLNGTRCTLDQIQTMYPDATIKTVAVTKGRDNAWQGAIDGLRINDDVFDFEPTGVNDLAP